MIIIFGGNKGGSGKTTTATNVSVGLALRGFDICLVDADQQRSASRWHKDRESENLTPIITLVEKLDNTSQTIKQLNYKYDYVIVDVPGRNSREMITAATVADMVVAPHQASQLDLDTLEELQGQVNHIETVNPDLKVFVYHAMASTNPSIKEAERNSFIKYVAEFEEFIHLDATGYFRKAYRDAIPRGESVLEGDNPQASNEIEALVDEILKRAKEEKPKRKVRDSIAERVG